MADKSKFEWHIKQIENADNTDSKLDALAAMLFTIATNDLACIEKRIKVTYVALVALGAAVFLGQSISIPSLIALVAKLMGG
jgi:hypothetical protein